MTSIVFLFTALVIGVLLRFVKSLPENTPGILGTLILHVPLPALCLLTIPDLEWRPSLFSLTPVTWIVFFLAYGAFSFLGKKFSWDKDLIGCLILTAGFCNSAFVGLPVVEALYGEEAMKYALFLDQTGSFLIVSTFGIGVALSFSSGKIKKRILFQKIIFFPPFISFLVGVGLSLCELRPEGMVREILQKLSLLLTPLALITVGLQLQWKNIKEHLKPLGLGLGFKLVLSPLVILIFYKILGVEKMILDVSVMEAGMATMVTSSILATTHHLRPKLAGMMVGIGVPLSFFSLTFFYFLLKVI